MDSGMKGMGMRIRKFAWNPYGDQSGCGTCVFLN